MATETFISMCRICLNIGATYPIFDNRDNEGSIYKKLQKCFNDTIEDKVDYPRSICLQCKNTVNSMYDFIELFQRSCKHLKQGLHLVKTEAECEYYSDTDNIEIDMIDFSIKPEPECSNIKEETKKLMQLLKPIPGLKITKIKNKTIKEKDKSVKKREKSCNNKKYKNNKKQDLNKSIAFSILEGEFDWNGVNWCLQKDMKSKSNNKSKVQEKQVKQVPKLTQDIKKKETTRLCDICGEVFSNSEDLCYHRRKHANDKKFCELCNKYYASTSFYNAHMKRIHGERTFNCTHCNRKYAFQGELKTHIKTVHYKHLEPKKIFSCKHCDKKYKCRKSVVVHERSVHTGLRPAVCKLCSSSFFHDDYLKEHMRLHTGDAPFKCPVCDRGHAQYSNMKSHLRIHRLSELDEITRSKIKPNHLRLLKP